MRIPILPLTLTAALALALTACSDANQSAGSVVVDGAVNCSFPPDGEPARAVDAPAGTDVPATGTVTATIGMTAGDVTLTLDREKAPCTVASFLSLAEQGFFDGTVCHRLVDYGIFVLQCGDPTATGMGGPGYTVPDELSKDLTYPRGTVAMANKGKANTGGSQFFLVWDDTELPPEYAVFATMDQAGIDVVSEIAAQGVSAADGVSPNAEAKITGVTFG